MKVLVGCVAVLLMTLVAIPASSSLVAASGPSVTTCSPVTWSSSNAEGTHNYKNGDVVQNDAWNGSHGPQTIYACARGQFYVTTNQPNADEAVDDWIGGQELMIWHRWTQPKGVYPPPGSTPVTIGGVGYKVYHSGTYTAFYRDVQVTSEVLQEVPFFQYMETQGWISATSVVDQFTNGVEVSDTQGTQTFSELSTSLTIS